MNLKNRPGVLYTMKDAAEPVTDQLTYDGAQDGHFIAIADTVTSVQRGDLELFLNVATSAAGSVRVELQEPNGKPIPGYSLSDCNIIIGDQIAHPVSWNGRTELSGLAGQPLRVRFELKDADVYAMQFE